MDQMVKWYRWLLIATCLRRKRYRNTPDSHAYYQGMEAGIRMCLMYPVEGRELANFDTGQESFLEDMLALGQMHENEGIYYSEYYDEHK